MKEKVNLKIDWCTHEAAKYACRYWHYSKCLPSGKVVKIGVWENGIFIGCILYSRGSTPHIGGPYSLNQSEVCELTRIALNKHETQVSRIMRISFKMLVKFAPGVRLIVSYSDMDMGHYGGIYQASNWVYTGLMNEGSRGAFIVNGKKTHPRSIGAIGGVQSIKWIKKHLDTHATEFFTKGKHKYLMPLDKEMRKQIEPLRKPYPKKISVSSIDSDATGDQSVEGGASPTDTLQK